MVNEALGNWCAPFIGRQAAPWLGAGAPLHSPYVSSERGTPGIGPYPLRNSASALAWKPPAAALCALMRSISA